MAYGDLPRRTAADKVLCDKAFNIAKNRGIVSMVYKLIDKKTAGGAVKNKIMQNKELA